MKMSACISILRTLSLLLCLTVSAVVCAEEKVVFDRNLSEITDTKTETFDRDPCWPGVNHRSARNQEPVTIRQDFGYCRTNHAGGLPGEIGGYISPAGEAAFYGKVIQPRTLTDPLRASGTFSCPAGGYHILLGFFNADSAKEWRTPNTIALRLNGRGEHFFAYVEYCTSRWRAGGDTTPFQKDPATGIGFPIAGRVYRWTLTYDPLGNNGQGVVGATIGDTTAICNLEKGHKADDAVFNRFGILNVIKSADNSGEVYFDDVTVNGVTETFDQDPRWDEKNNRCAYQSRIVRPRFDFGYSPTTFAGGRTRGELGGIIFRGDCRYPSSMACIGDIVGPLTLDRPFRASGKIAMTRGVSDSTTLFGFYNSQDSMRPNYSQSNAIPEAVVGIHIEGPSRDGFLFYPVCRVRGGSGRAADLKSCPAIYPDGKSHGWSLEYHPIAAGDRGRIKVTLDGSSAFLDLDHGARASGITLDRFGIVTSWIDGNSQSVYWDDITYTVKQ